MCTTHGLCPNLGQTNVVKLSLLHQFVEHLSIMLDGVVPIKSRWLEQIKPLRSTQGLEDGIDTPTQVLSAPVCFQQARKHSAFDGEESAVCVIWILVEEAGEQFEIRCRQASSIELG
jgi:hypothetical protein